MANYVKATNFFAKDALLTGDPAKIIKGAEIDDEYNAIATAIATKANLNSPEFTGVPIAPTAAFGTSTTQVATTKFVQDSTGTIALQNANNVAITGGTITGITDLAVADGGTGSSTLTANNVLLGNGTSPVNFVAPGTSGNILTSDGTTWESSAPAPTLGVGQTWQDVTSSRSLSTPYTNSTGAPIMINVWTNNFSSTTDISILVEGVTVAFKRTAPGGFTENHGLNAVIPNGLTYSVVSGTSINKWFELR
jgi:hypothetical protein